MYTMRRMIRTRHIVAPPELPLELTMDPAHHKDAVFDMFLPAASYLRVPGYG